MLQELQKELDAEKLQVANLESALQEKTQQVSRLSKLYKPLNLKGTSKRSERSCKP